MTPSILSTRTSPPPLYILVLVQCIQTGIKKINPHFTYIGIIPIILIQIKTFPIFSLFVRQNICVPHNNQKENNEIKQQDPAATGKLFCLQQAVINYHQRYERRRGYTTWFKKRSLHRNRCNRAHLRSTHTVSTNFNVMDQWLTFFFFFFFASDRWWVQFQQHKFLQSYNRREKK